ncbi:MAG: thioredoxin domain-containing protein [Deltaproteobacteria bacterium]|nr:thioredoxin domain-containing protein [Deltaproteobacteria bacterium]MBI3295128.1 thioredoxin domain-containing protein [Deltaproteobacteria bacterium]
MRFIASLVTSIFTMILIGGCTGGGGGNDVVAEYNGKKVTASEAFAQVKTRLFDLEEEMYRTKEQAINDFVEQRLLDGEAKKQNLSIDALVEKEAGGDVGDVADKDVEEFLTSKGLSLKDPRVRKDDVKDYLKYRKKFEKRQNFVQKLRMAANVKLMMKEPESPKLTVDVAGYPTWGNANAPVTIVEFSDYQCPFCARAVPTLDRIKKEYGPDKVKIVFRDMPLPSHPRAPFASQAAHCGDDQGKFWEFHNILFENQAKLEDKDLEEYAKKLGMDGAKFKECMAAKKHQALIEKSAKEAGGLGIQATPSFVINGTLLQGAQPFEKFKEKIDRASNKRG